MNGPLEPLSYFGTLECGRSGSRTKKIINILACQVIQKSLSLSHLLNFVNVYFINMFTDYSYSKTGSRQPGQASRNKVQTNRMMKSGLHVLQLCSVSSLSDFYMLSFLGFSSQTEEQRIGHCRRGVDQGQSTQVPV